MVGNGKGSARSELAAGRCRGVEDGLAAHEEVNAFFHLAWTDAGQLPAAEPDLRLAASRGLVEVDHAGFDSVAEALKLATILRVDARDEAVVAVIDGIEAILEGLNGTHGEHWAEHLLPPDRNERLDHQERRGLHEKPVLQISKKFAPAPEQDRLTLDDRFVAHRVHALESCLGGQRPHGLDVRIVAESKRDLTGPFGEPPDELILHARVHHYPLGRGTALSGRTPLARDHALNREVEIRMLADVNGVVAAELGLVRDRHDPLREQTVDLVPHQRRTGDGHSAYIRMKHERLDDLAAALHDVEHAVRHARRHQHLADQRVHSRRVFGTLEHYRVAGDERGNELPEWNRHWEVPRCDERHDPERTRARRELDSSALA